MVPDSATSSNSKVKLAVVLYEKLCGPVLIGIKNPSHSIPPFELFANGVIFPV